MPTLEQTDYAEIEVILREASDLEDNVSISSSTKISNLVSRTGKLPEPIDLLDILHKLGINACEYCSGERLNSKEIRMLEYVLRISQRQSPERNLFDKRVEEARKKGEELIITTDEVLKYITPNYLAGMQMYPAKTSTT